MGPFWNAFYGAGADVILNGHEHNYERFGRQDPNARATEAGIRQFVVGTGGGGLYSFGNPEPNSEFREASTFGVLKLTLHPTSYEWEFVSSAGEVVDAGGPRRLPLKESRLLIDQRKRPAAHTALSDGAWPGIPPACCCSSTPQREWPSCMAPTGEWCASRD